MDLEDLGGPKGIEIGEVGDCEVLEAGISIS